MRVGLEPISDEEYLKLLETHDEVELCFICHRLLTVDRLEDGMCEGCEMDIDALESF